MSNYQYPDVADVIDIVFVMQGLKIDLDVWQMNEQTIKVYDIH